MSKIGAVGDYSYLSQLRQAQSSNNGGKGPFGMVSTNGNGSVSQDEATAFMSSLTAQLQNAQSNSGSDSVSAFLSLLQNLGQTGATSGTAGTTGTPASLSGEAYDAFAGMNANGNGLLGQAGLASFESSLTAQVENGGAGSGKTSNQAEASDGSTAAAFVQQALEKYMQLTPVGHGLAAVGSFLGIV